MDKSGVELLETLGDFTIKENWDKFFTLRGRGDAFEWYAEWPALRDPLLSQLSSPGDHPLQVLVPGCGSSRMSEHLYDAGYRSVTNIDFSKVVVSDMLRRNVRARPEMRWRVMDMTEMQFADGSFDAIIDKGGLDALMEPKLGAKLGSKFLKEVKRVLKLGGKYICLTLAESHVLGLLFSEFRLGWKMSIHVIPHKLQNKCNFQTYMVVSVKEGSGEPNPILSLLDPTTVNDSAHQGHTLVRAIEDENKIRYDISSGADVIHSLEDLRLGTKGVLKELIPGRRCHFVLGEQGVSCFSYNALLLDSQQQTDAFLYHCGIFIVPKIRAHEWLFSSEEGQWAVVESSKAARLIMVFLDSTHSHAGIDGIQRDLSPLVKNLAPGDSDNEAPIPFMMASDGIKQRNVVKKVTSAATGPIIVEDVMYENLDGDNICVTSRESMIYRRLTFERSLGLVQSEALLVQEHSRSILGEAEKNKSSLSSRHQKKGTRRRKDSCETTMASRGNLKIDHSYLASCYHSGIISGFILVAPALESAASCGKLVRTIVVGLGAGLLPMCLRGCLPFLDIEVVELDPVILDLAKSYFGFTEDEKLKVHIADGIQFIHGACAAESSAATMNDEKTVSLNGCAHLPHRTSTKSPSHGNGGTEMRMLVVDADASDVSSGLTCPPAEFLEESFLLSVREFVGEGGLFVINLVSRSTAIREMVVSRMKEVFNHLFSLELEEDVNEVLFALPSEACVQVDDLRCTAVRFQRLLKFNQPERVKAIIDMTENIKCLK
uniref:Methyltransferase-like protein 13 n=1 Tax=Anthurium amnicola TaxID=1678845 RepID=A0A1D1Y6U2_9ARAE